MTALLELIIVNTRKVYDFGFYRTCGDIDIPARRVNKCSGNNPSGVWYTTSYVIHSPSRDRTEDAVKKADCSCTRSCV